MPDNSRDFLSFTVGDQGPMGKTIKEIIIRSNTCIVYMDIEDTIQWASERRTELNANFGDIQNKISNWESISNKIFTKKDAYDYKCLLAEAYARILDGTNADHANQIIERTVNRITKHGKEILKQNYVISSFFCTILVTIVLAAIVYFRTPIRSLIGNDSFEVILTICFGGIGAFVFTVIRSSNYSPEIFIGKSIHRIDGALRIFFGLISGLIIAIGIKSNIVFGFIDKANTTIYVKAFLGIIGGASEVLIPNLIKQIEKKANTEKPESSNPDS